VIDRFIEKFFGAIDWLAEQIEKWFTKWIG
jgi:hypothetical protein